VSDQTLYNDRSWRRAAGSPSGRAYVAHGRPSNRRDFTGAVLVDARLFEFTMEEGEEIGGRIIQSIEGAAVGRFNKQHSGERCVATLQEHTVRGPKKRPTISYTLVKLEAVGGSSSSRPQE